MTVHDLYSLLAANEIWVLIGIGALPIVIGMISAALRLIRKKDLSQQVANVGIALGLMAVLVECLAVAYAVMVLEVNPIAEASIGLLFGPPYLLIAGFVAEHLIHPEPQKHIRSKLRFALMSVAFVVLLGAVFSVLRIYMLVFTNIFGFVIFLLCLLVGFYFIVRKLI